MIRKFLSIFSNPRNLIPIIATVAVVSGLVAALLSPPDLRMGNLVKIMYPHVASAWLAFVAFIVTGVGSAGWLISRRMHFDHTAVASAEIGVMFTAIAVLTGMIWGQPIWGTPWHWGDARLTSTAVMFFVYVGYLALRRATTDPYIRARRSSVLGIIAVVQVPIVYFSVTLWRTLHQGFTVRPDGINLSGSMVFTLFFNVAAFSLLYIALSSARTRLAAREAEVYQEEGQTAGSVVTAPSLEAGR